MKTIILVACLAALAAADFNNYKVFRVVPSDPHQLDVVRKFDNMKGIDFWSKARAVERNIDIMVSPEMEGQFRHVMTHNSVDHSVLIDNVETVIQREAMEQMLSPRMPEGRINLNKFNRYGDIVAYLKQLQEEYPDKVNVSSIGKSYEQRDIMMIRISTGGANKPAILVDGGIHAREWASPATVVSFIHHLVEDPANSNMISNVDWYIIPVLNPDGYEYTFTPGNRLWRKTRSQGVFCKGTDANRNFGFHWMEVGASDNECSETYGGRKAFSEPETQNLKALVEAIGSKVKLYLTFHSYGEYLLYPWGWTSDLPENVDDLDGLAQDVAAAIYAVDRTRYTIGSSTNVLYAAAGGSDDWVKGVGGVDLTYTIELPGGGPNGFDPPPTALAGIIEETFEGLKVYHDYVAKLQ